METWHDKDTSSARTPLRFSDSYHLPVFRPYKTSVTVCGRFTAGSDRWSSLEDVDRRLVSSFLFSALKREKCSWFHQLSRRHSTNQSASRALPYDQLLPSPQPVGMSRGSEAEPRSDDQNLTKMTHTNPRRPCLFKEPVKHDGIWNLISCEGQE
jgi:hypothetical protein